MKSPRSSRVRAAHAAKRMMRARQPAVGNSPLRNLYLGETEPYVPAAEELVIPLNERKYIQTLTESCCRWPIGDPQQPDFHFCGKKKIPGLPYCEVHARRAFQPPQARRRERDFVPVPMVVLPGSAAAPSMPHSPDQSSEKAAV
jgi:GcrA cell cycle regulator